MPWLTPTGRERPSCPRGRVGKAVAIAVSGPHNCPQPTRLRAHRALHLTGEAEPVHEGAGENRAPTDLIVGPRRSTGRWLPSAGGHDLASDPGLRARHRRSLTVRSLQAGLPVTRDIAVSLRDAQSLRNADLGHHRKPITGTRPELDVNLSSRPSRRGPPRVARRPRAPVAGGNRAGPPSEAVKDVRGRASRSPRIRLR